jgi:ribonuclease P protein component
MAAKGLKKDNQFRLVYRRGERAVGRYITICYLKTDEGGILPGFVASKRSVGKAYQRNRAKRIMREIYKEFADSVTEKNLWIVFVASFRPQESSFQDLKEDVRSSLGKAGLISLSG